VRKLPFTPIYSHLLPFTPIYSHLLPFTPIYSHLFPLLAALSHLFPFIPIIGCALPFIPILFPLLAALQWSKQEFSPNYTHFLKRSKIILCPARDRASLSHLFSKAKSVPRPKSIFSCIIAITLPILGTRRSKGYQSTGTINTLRAVVLVWGETLFFHFLQADKVRRNHLPHRIISIIVTKHNHCYVNKRFRCSTWCQGEYLWRNFHSG